jgi:3-oxoacyl-[acyl-carrier-protein] synthase-3
MFNKNIYINDIAVFLPNEPVSNKEIETILGQVNEQKSKAKAIILRSNKIKTRYYAINKTTKEVSHTNAEMTAAAIKKLSLYSDNHSKVQLLACGTSTPDQLIPNHALMVQGELSGEPCEVISISGVCLSGVSALKYAYLSIMSGETETAICTGSETASTHLRAQNYSPEINAKIKLLKKKLDIAFEKDFLRWMLSDGAGAFAISNKPNLDKFSLKIKWIYQKSYANEAETCMYAGAIKNTDGSLKIWPHLSQQEWLDESVFSVKQDVKVLHEGLAEYTVIKPMNELMSKGMLNPDEIDYFLPHYSSDFFKDKLHETMLSINCEIPQEKWFTNLSSKGNTGSASIYIMLEELFKSNKLKKGDIILCYVPESARFSVGLFKLKVE